MTTDISNNAQSDWRTASPKRPNILHPLVGVSARQLFYTTSCNPDYHEKDRRSSSLSLVEVTKSWATGVALW